MLWGRRAKNRKLPGLVRMGMIVGDLNEVEEWNEYGELKENVEPAGTRTDTISTPTPSATSTPSKPPPSTTIPSNPPSAPADTTTESSEPTSSTGFSSAPAPAKEASFTTALRQAGFEAAKKANDAKTKAQQDALAAAKSKDDELQKLDNSGPTGMAPPSGVTEAADAKEPETAGAVVESKADKVPVTGEGSTEEVEDAAHDDDEAIQVAKAEKQSTSNPITTGEPEEVLEGTGQAEPPAPPAQDIPSIAPPPSSDNVPSAADVEAAANESILKDKSHIVLAGREADRTPPAERADLGKEQVPEEPKTISETPLREVTATDEAQDLPGKKTQEQEAAEGEEAGTSVAD